MTWLLVAIGAAVGAPLRYLTDRAVQARHDSRFPWGTLTVNVAGSFLLGLVIGLPAGAAATALRTRSGKPHAVPGWSPTAMKSDGSITTKPTNATRRPRRSTICGR